jgi:hypothetical protein
MESTMKRIADDPRIEVLDERGRVIGVITRPVAPEVLGPGREKVYLARSRPERASHAA